MSCTSWDKFAAGMAIVAGLGCGGASAQKFDLKISGDVYSEFAFVSSDKDAGMRSTEMTNRFRLVLQPIAKADNGLEYGARLRIRAAGGNGSVDNDRAFLFVNGSFGTIQAGLNSGLGGATLLNYQAPLDYQLLTLTDDAIGFITAQTVTGNVVRGADTASALTFNTLTARYPSPNGTTTKLTYYSPSFSGVQAAFTYTPRSDSSNTDVNRVKAVDAGPTAAQRVFMDIVESALIYDGKWDKWYVKANAHFAFGRPADSGANPAGFKPLRVWEMGGQVGYGPWSVGGGYLNSGETGQSKAAAARRADGSVWHAAAQYNAAPWTVGFGYQRGVDAGSLAVAGSRKLDLYDVGFLYQIAPGLRAGAQYNYYKSVSDQTTKTLDRNDKGSVVMIRSILTF